ncbi:MAG TPA: hypothetical protein PKA66_07355 [Gemmatimonadales bacterium]|nr:hypothetical protein [Gemmatimonadales bacterium]
MVPALDATSSALSRAGRSSTALNGGLESLSRSGLSKVESGFKALAFQAAGVPGPMGKIAEGALLLGAGSGVLLAVAAAAGTLALVWQKFGAVSDEAKDAVERMTKALNTQQQAILDIAAADAEVARQRKKAGLFAFFAEGGTSGILGAIAKHFNDVADGIERTTRAYTALQAHGAADDFLIGFWKNNPMPKPGPKAKKVTQPEPAQNWWLNQDFTQQSAVLGLKQQLADLNAELLQVPINMAGVEAVTAELDQAFAKATDRVGMYFDAFSEAFMGLAEGLGQVAVGMANLGDVLSNALTQAVAGAAKVMAKYELGQAAASFAAALGPIPQPGMVAAGFKHLAAAAAFGIVAGLAGAAGAAGGGGVGNNSRAVSGGVDGGQYGREQRELASRGKLTLHIKDGVIGTRSPEFRDMITDVIREAGALRELEVTYT